MNLKDHIPALKYGAKVLPSEVRGFCGMTTGNVYYVIKTAETFYSQFVSDHQCTYSDGSQAVHGDDGAGSGIISALAATVECRNDYVLVQPSNGDYDITAALVMDKKAVHLICPAGLGYTRGANNACRIHQTGAYPVINVTDAAVEIAGFYFKNYATKGGIILGAGTYGLNIHHNYWAMNLSGGTNEPMLGPLIANITQDYGAWSTIDSNFFQSQSGASATIAAIIRTNAQATGTRIVNNDIQIGDTDNTATVGILNGSVKGIVNDNHLMAAQTASGAGVFTHGVQIHASGSAIGNKLALASGATAGVVGGTDEVSFVDNNTGVAGGMDGTEA